MQRLDASEINSLSMTNTDEIEEAKEKVDKRQEKIAQRKADLEANSYSYKAAKVIQKAFDQYFLDPILGFFMPGFGDILTSTLTLPFIYLALFEIKSIPLTLAIIYNALMDILKGLFPVIGDIFDAFNKSYTKSFRLINGFVDDDETIKREVNKKAFKTLILSFILGGLIYFTYIMVMSITEYFWETFYGQKANIELLSYNTTSSERLLLRNQKYADLEGIWEIRSKEDVYDGLSTEEILELRPDRTFIETTTSFWKDTVSFQITTRGIYTLEDIYHVYASKETEFSLYKRIEHAKFKFYTHPIAYNEYNEYCGFDEYDAEETYNAFVDQFDYDNNVFDSITRPDKRVLILGYPSRAEEVAKFGLPYVKVDGETMLWSSQYVEIGGGTIRWSSGKYKHRAKRIRVKESRKPVQLSKRPDITREKSFNI